MRKIYSTKHQFCRIIDSWMTVQSWTIQDWNGTKCKLPKQQSSHKKWKTCLRSNSCRAMQLCMRIKQNCNSKWEKVKSTCKSFVYVLLQMQSRNELLLFVCHCTGVHSHKNACCSRCNHLCNRCIQSRLWVRNQVCQGFWFCVPTRRTQVANVIRIKRLWLKIFCHNFRIVPTKVAVNFQVVLLELHNSQTTPKTDQVIDCVVNGFVDTIAFTHMDEIRIWVQWGVAIRAAIDKIGKCIASLDYLFFVFDWVDFNTKKNTAAIVSSAILANINKGFTIFSTIQELLWTKLVS